MEVAAKLSGARISAQKARLVADQIRGLPVGKALDILTFSTHKASDLVKKVLESAIANAENNAQPDVDRLFVAEAFVGRTLVMKRFRPRARGRAAGIEKPFANLTIVVRERTEVEAA